MLLKIFTLILFQTPFTDLETDTLPQTEQVAVKGPLQIACLWLVALHQNYLTHIDGPRSHFYPCSSSYMKQALMKYGFFKGSLLGLNRLLHENSDPWIYPKKQLNEETWIKLDPVP